MDKNQDPGSGMLDKHPGSATLFLYLLFSKILFVSRLSHVPYSYFNVTEVG
jgi:hypothetical protein